MVDWSLTDKKSMPLSQDQSRVRIETVAWEGGTGLASGESDGTLKPLMD